MLFRKIFPIIQIILLNTIVSFAQSKNTQSDSTNRALQEALQSHWQIIAKLYEEIDNPELAQMARDYANQIADTLNENNLINLLANHIHQYIESWVKQDVYTILSMTAPVFLLPLYTNGLTKNEQEDFFKEFFSTYPQVSQLIFEDIYIYETIEVLQFDQNKAMLTVQAQDSPPEVLQEWNYWSNFWNNTHHYFFQKMADNQWYLLAFDMEDYHSFVPIEIHAE